MVGVVVSQVSGEFVVSEHDAEAPKSKHCGGGFNPNGLSESRSTINISRVRLPHSFLMVAVP